MSDYTGPMETGAEESRRNQQRTHTEILFDLIGRWQEGEVSNQVLIRDLSGMAANTDHLEARLSKMEPQLKQAMDALGMTWGDLESFGSTCEGIADAMERDIARLSKMDAALDKFDIQGAKSWARATVEQWNHSDAETRQIMYGGMKVAEKLLAILPELEEALAGEKHE